jgi:uncharacterized membrane protein YhaH (DUF805 family)
MWEDDEADLTVEPETPPPAQVADESVWDLQGRIGRADYWVRLIFLNICGSVVLFLFAAFAQNGGNSAIIALLVCVAYFVGATWFGVVMQVKRWHDLDKSGWMVLLNFTLIFVPVAFIWHGFVRGTIGPNRFGKDPTQPPAMR